MRKVTKIIIKVIVGIVLAAIIIPIIIALLLLMPPVQNFVVGVATKRASDYLGTTVEIERLYLRPFSRLSVRGVYVEDFHQDTLLYAQNLNVNIISLGLPKLNPQLGKVKLSGTRFSMVEEEDGTTNLGQLVEKLKFERREKGKRPLRISATAIEVDDMHFSLLRSGAISQATGINFNDIDLQNIDVKTRDFRIRNDSLSLRIDEISFWEKSGFEMSNISAEEVGLSEAGLHIGGLSVVTPNSNLSLGVLDITRIEEKEELDVENYMVNVSFVNSSLSTKTVAYFLPPLSGMEASLYNVNGAISGSVKSLFGNFTSIEVGESGETELSFSFTAEELLDETKRHFVINLDRMYSNSEDIKMLYGQLVKGRSLDELPFWREQVKEKIAMRGYFEGGYNDFRADAELSLNGGKVDFDLQFKPAKKQMTHFRGHVGVEDIKLTELLNDDKLGSVSFEVGLDGEFGKGNLMAKADALLTKIEYNDYVYSDVLMTGDFQNKQFKGDITSSDPNVDFKFAGMLDFNDTIPEYDFDLDLFNVDLCRLNFNKRDSISWVKARVDATGSGTSLDDLNGEIVLSNMLYVNHMDSVATGEVRIVGLNSPESKSLKLRSAFADIDYRSRTSYSQVVDDLRRVIHYYVPTLSEREKEDKRIDFAAISEVDNYSLLNINIKEANNVASIFVPGFMISSGSKLSFMFNPKVDRLSLTANSDYIEFGNSFISKLDVNSQNQGDSINLFVRADDMLLKWLYLPNFSVIGALKENQLNATMRVLNPEEQISALVGLQSVFYVDPISGEPELLVRFSPSNIKSKEQEWDIFTRGIRFTKDRVLVDNFTVLGTNQELRVNGVAGRSRADTLNVSLSKFNLLPISSLTSGEGYYIDGNATGKAQVVSALEDGFLSARVNFADTKINNVKVPDGFFESTWDMERERARFALSTLNTKDTLISGYYLPSLGEYRGEVKLQDVDLSLLHPLLEDEMKSIEGSADFDVRITGGKSGFRLDGHADIEEIVLDVNFIHVPFTVKKARLFVDNNKLWFKGQPFYDPLGNKGLFDIEVDLNNIKNVSYNLSLHPESMMLYNTTKKESPLFYGRVFATGHAKIKGDKSRTDIDVTANTTGNSQFFLPLAGEETMGVSNIITFLSPEQQKVDSTDYEIRRQLMLERRFRERQRVKEENLHVKLALNVTPDVDFQLLIDPAVGDVISGKGEGSLTLNINPQNDVFAMYGDYEIVKGTYQFTIQNIISKRFAIESGSKIIWTGEPADPILDVTGVYKLKASLNPLLGSSQMYSRTVPVECRILLSDRAQQPTVNFDIDVSTTPEFKTLVDNELSTQENMATQFFFLVAANSFYPTAYTGNIGTAASSSAMFDILANQVSNIISNDKFNLGFHYKPKDDMTSDEYNIDFSTQLFGDRVLLEVEGNYDVGNVPNLSSEKVKNLTGDFYLTWLIDENGNLRAKGFTRTIDRFDENQGLQESGIGLYYKEDFNTFRDIKDNFRKRFGRKRREKREEKERQRQEEERLREENEQQEEREDEERKREQQEALFEEQEYAEREEQGAAEEE